MSDLGTARRNVFTDKLMFLHVNRKGAITCKACNDTGWNRFARKDGSGLNINCSCDKGGKVMNNFIDKCIADENITLVAKSCGDENCYACGGEAH